MDLQDFIHRQRVAVEGVDEYSDSGSIQASPVLASGNANGFLENAGDLSKQAFHPSHSSDLSASTFGTLMLKESSPSSSATTAMTSWEVVSSSSSSLAQQRGQGFNKAPPLHLSTAIDGNDIVDDEDEDEIEAETSRPPLSAAAKVKSFFPKIGSFYKPLSARGPLALEQDNDDQVNIPHNTNSNMPAPYDQTANSSQLSFNDNSATTEAELVSKSSVLDPKRAGGELLRFPVRRSLPKHQRSSQFMGKKLTFNDTAKVNHDEVDGVLLSQKSPHTSPQTPTKEEDEDDTLLPLASTLPTASSPDDVYAAGYCRSLPLNSSHKLMTKTQFDNYRRSMLVLSEQTEKETDRRSKLLGGLDVSSDNNSDTSENDDEDFDDEENDDDNSRARRNKFEEDAESKKQNIRMRMKQDAHLSVYRQKMTKVTGSQTGLSAYSTELRLSSSYAALNDLINDDDDEYDDVPLGILKAHGFPTGSRSRPLSAQPSLARLGGEKLHQGPNVLYQPRQNGETASLRSVHSIGGMRPDNVNNNGLTPLPPFFSNPANNMTRGLVGQIAREEEAKQRRKSMGNPLGGQRSSTMMQSSASTVFNSNANYAGSMYNGAAPHNNNNGSEIQQQLQQMMQMQMQMLQQMQTPAAAPSPPPFKKHWSSFDIPKSHGAAPSIRSFAPSERSVDSGRLQHSAMLSLHDLAQPELRTSKSQPFISHSQSSPRLSRPVSTLRMAVAEDDEEDDDAGWQEMLEKRLQLKEMWKQQQSVALVS